MNNQLKTDANAENSEYIDTEMELSFKYNKILLNNFI